MTEYEMDKLDITRNIQRTLPDAQILETVLPLCPEIRLYLISPDNMKRRFSVIETRRIFDTTPYWAFCWASGQAMAYYLLRNKKLVEGKTILDFGSGSGVAAIAAALAGAGKVIACDNDPNAIDAIKANAHLNMADVQTCESLAGLADGIDFIITADVLYDRENYGFLEDFLRLAPVIYVADSRVTNIGLAPFKKIAGIEITTLPDIHEGEEFKHVNIYRAVT